MCSDNTATDVNLNALSVPEHFLFLQQGWILLEVIF